MNSLQKILFSLLLVFSPFLAFSQTHPAIMVKDSEGKSSPLRMDELKVEVKVLGKIATTTLDMTFTNDLDRILEGQLYFPLGEGQTVSRFAMDVNGKLREGVVVEKEKGQAVFESIVRRNIDPGLLEWTKGNNFKARVYPIPAKGHKRIVVAYEQELPSVKKGLLYTLPMNFPHELKVFDLEVEVFKQEVSPILEGNELANLRFQRWEENWTAGLHQEYYTAQEQIGFVVPKTPMIAEVYMETLPQKGNYFYVSMEPEMTSIAKKSPKSVCILWDVSTSGKDQNVQKNLALLDWYFDWVKKAKVQVVFFSNEPERPKSGFVSSGNWSALRSIIEGASYDGGTQLGSLNLDKYEADEFLLFTDGISNIGSVRPNGGKAPVYVINSSQNGEHGLLRSLAEGSGGLYLNLNRMSEANSHDALISLPFRLINIKYDSEVLSDLYPSGPVVVEGEYTLAGKCSGKPTEVTLEFGIGQDVLLSRSIEIDQDKNMSNSGLVPRLWAQKKLSELELDPKRNENQILAHGKEWSLVTRGTSLIVLDLLEDYVANEIVPPKELQQEYFAAIQAREQEEKSAKEAHLQQVIQMFEARLAWYERDFPKGEAPKLNLEEKTMGSDGDFGDDDWGEVEEVVEEAEAMESAPLEVSDSFEMDEDFSDSFDDNGDGWGDDFEEVEQKEEAKGRKGGKGKASIELAAWDPKEPYMEALKQASDQGLYEAYLQQKSTYGKMPAYYLDAADYLIQRNKKREAMRVLSNIAEMELENYRLLRILGYKLLQLGYVEEAVGFFREVLKLRPEEPQSYRDLGLALARQGETQEAIEQLYYIANYPWDSRFPEVELIAIEEMNAVIAKASKKPNLKDIEPRLIRQMPMDLRVVLTWDADACDMDLWVTDPNNEKCFFSHKDTYQGGKMSLDFTGGYGPEEYLIKKAKPGPYKVQVNYYGNRQQSLSGATTIQVQMITNFGTKREKMKEVTLRLKSEKEILDIGELLVE